MSYKQSRAGAGDFIVGGAVAAIVLGVLFALVGFSERMILAFY